MTNNFKLEDLLFVLNSSNNKYILTTNEHPKVIEGYKTKKFIDDMTSVDSIKLKYKDETITILISELSEEDRALSWPDFFNSRLFTLIKETYNNKILEKEQKIKEFKEQKIKSGENTFLETEFIKIAHLFKLTRKPKMKLWDIQSFARSGDQLAYNLIYKFFEKTYGNELTADQVNHRQLCLTNTAMKNAFEATIKKSYDETDHTMGTVFEAILYMAYSQNRHNIVNQLMDNLIKSASKLLLLNKP